MNLRKIAADAGMYMLASGLKMTPQTAEQKSTYNTGNIMY